MGTLIDKLRSLYVPTVRENHALINLIGRIEYFEKVGDMRKLEDCKAEAENWLQRSGQ